MPSTKQSTLELPNRTIELPFPASSIFLLPGICLAIVMYDYNANRSQARFQNIVAYDYDGVQVWHAELPSTSMPDCFTELRSASEEKIEAFSYSCFSCVINPKTGKLERKEFTK